MTTRAVPNADPKKDLRVIWSGDGKTIVSDQRNRQPSSTPKPLSSPATPSYQQQPQKPSSVPKPFRHVKVIGRKPK